MTAHDVESTSEQASDLGSYDTVRKPFDRAEVVPTWWSCREKRRNEKGGGGMKDTRSVAESASKTGANMKWYALRTCSRSERIVRDQLAEHGIDALLPLVRRVSPWKERKKVIEWPVFPGYCFARCTVDQCLIVRKWPGVVEIVGTGKGWPEPIPDSEILAVQRVIAIHGQLGQYDAHPNLDEGMIVQVSGGPLRGIQGRLVRRHHGWRLVIPIHLIHQAVAVQIAADNIIPIERHIGMRTVA